MSTDEKKIIAKLYAIAQKQQKVIQGLVKQAQSAELDTAYLNRLVTLVSANAGVPGMQASISPQNGTYVVTLKGLSNNQLKQSVVDNFNKAITLQRPDLDGKVDFIFQG